VVDLDLGGVAAASAGTATAAAARCLCKVKYEIPFQVGAPRPRRHLPACLPAYVLGRRG
jgi:hypothetical protein